jgi:hypothetical protein
VEEITVSDKITPRPPQPNLESEGVPDSTPSIGAWFQVQERDDKEPWLGCVTHIGSNYVEIHSVGSSYTRVHLDNFEKVCTFEPDAEAIIANNIQHWGRRAQELMGRVKEITAQLSVHIDARALPGGETQALALRGSGQEIGEYKNALVKAKEKDLPELFKEIESANKEMGAWMKASLVPLKAQAEQLKPAIKAIESRIFNVELYAGLVEQVEQIADGEPARLEEKVHLFQRRCYMDEECLAEYRAGGMEFKDLREFDAWLVEKENLNRLLPFPRCIVAFRVRRNEKEREVPNLQAYINIALGGERDADKMTFLYMRNGDRVFRLSTAIEFGEQLFPDMGHAGLTGKLYAELWGAGSVRRLITEGEYLEMRKDDARRLWEHRKKRKREDRWWTPTKESRDFTAFTPETVYYDDIREHVQEQIEKHNRLVLVLQGILDRSPVMHPHPNWRLWTPEGFTSALQLVYDDSRALTTGDAPDFEAYRQLLNADFAPGSVAVGQDDFWQRAEAVKENERMDRLGRGGRYDFHVKRYRPYGNPGPGVTARPTHVGKRGCTFAWVRERQTARRWSDEPRTFPCRLVVPTYELLNVSSYTPGDFKRFFADPRTRADYLKWAPLLLEAEEYYAGNRPIRGEAK